ncbi:MAG TPA: hypothetical protein VMU81_02160 [Acetobacteraceae bacterium]|jgi:hypothetical protein|nr:hypothetical protein [Acetobacteraceae bacterium]
MGLKVSDPLFGAMAAVVHSVDGVKAAVLATSKGLPALAGVDPLLQAELGTQYTRADDVTMNAGWLVAQQMREMGFVDAGSGKMPRDCVAAEALRFKLPLI